MKSSRVTVIVTIALLIISTFVLISLLTNRGYAEIQIDMPNFGKVWQEYIAAPNSENAQKVYSMLPGNRDEVVRLQVEVRPLIIGNLNTIERQIFSGDHDALKIAFRLLTIADADIEKELAKILGNLVRFNARLFLQELQNHRDLVPDLSVLLCSYLEVPDMEEAAQELEQKSRISALGYVENEELKDIKKECIKTLKKCKAK